jgi:hypothetical protein
LLVTEDPAGADGLPTVVTEPAVVVVGWGATRTGGLVTEGAPVELDEVGVATGLDVVGTVTAALVEVVDVASGYPAEVEEVVTAEDEVDESWAEVVVAAAEVVLVDEAGVVETVTGPPTGVPGAGATLPV